MFIPQDALRTVLQFFDLTENKLELTAQLPLFHEVKRFLKGLRITVRSSSQGQKTTRTIRDLEPAGAMYQFNDRNGRRTTVRVNHPITRSSGQRLIPSHRTTSCKHTINASNSLRSWRSSYPNRMLLHRLSFLSNCATSFRDRYTRSVFLPTLQVRQSLLEPPRHSSDGMPSLVLGINMLNLQ